jgi:hypothetical protein
MASSYEARSSGRPYVAIVPEERIDLWSRMDAELQGAGAILLVLPKWEAVGTGDARGWIKEVRRKEPDVIRSALRSVVSDAQMVVAKSPSRLPAALVEPHTISSDSLEPVVTIDGQILVGELSGRQPRTWILSDPDVIANHGITRGENVRLAVGLIKRLLPGAETVMLAERSTQSVAAVHNPAEVVFTFPFALIPLTFAAFVLVLGWGALGRFGSPLTALMVVRLGKHALIESAVGLITTSAQRFDVARRYARLALRDVCASLRAPREVDEQEAIEWIERTRRGGRRSPGYKALMQELDEAARAGLSDRNALASFAARIHRWKKELLNGPVGDTEFGEEPEDRGREGGRWTERGDRPFPYQSSL